VKGIAHFISGIAIATFIPGAVQQAAGGSFLLVLGGLGGLLPDTLDFRFGRYLERYELVIDPHPQDFRPQTIATRIATVIRAVHQTGRPQTVKLHTLQVGASQWRAYTLGLDAASSTVTVQAGPVIDISGATRPAAPLPEEPPARVPAGVPLWRVDDIRVDILDGPSVRFERGGDRVRAIFLPWHRRWSHSLFLAAALGAGAGLLINPLAGLASGLGYGIHILQDQSGHMGSNLFWPLSRKRVPGLKWMHAGDPLPNSATVWVAVGLIVYNLDRFSDLRRLPAGLYLLVAVGLPLLLVLARYARGRRAVSSASAPVEASDEVLAETEELLV
jgi:membrane-bound metal-dependent hydrolase YbcI (DUF457 family)